MSQMTRASAIVAAAGMLFVACTKVPYTDRKQLNLVPKATMHNIGESTYAEMLASVKVKKRGRDAELLNQVGRRIAKVADQPDFDWSFALIADPQMNAWCLPGGYIGFYEGILPVLDNEAGMAFVMGHEVGHAVARHGAERMSQQLLTVGGLSALQLFLSGSSEMSEETRGLIMAAAGATAQVGVLLPFSRAHEKESDTIGMMYMAGAGYPPGESIRVWERLEAAAGGGGIPLLSTHPSFASRKENQQAWLPAARKRFKRNRRDEDTRASIWGQ